ncbi:1-deoxy-D-xylulose-5-phosphate synthase [Rickettsiales endosymbiont of Peranema trichophorum]|uniref:1-deoxy-D-xylulose-5-phosphate synthase n=1 Tax=Rickettsiales endosymbiont of Peranema trichophorum TaxID=2486577 RepID=UPI001023AA68|nr:1-deoxy-D-xylulose-5-phosphate synthase [Rickettsiales endosymbiont of Peranema trichophorum]RZI45086.1 1-deoxy-D-xylulose-5-phosphate synthase [Rickettsiales endosymbiont of Peranema trichophorum]
MTHDNRTILDYIFYPSDLKTLSIEELQTVSAQLRERIIDIVLQTGGHLGAGLGVVELTVALHHVFDTPKDLLVWDIGHQAYPHKYLTGRKDKLHTIRQPEGLSGFLKRQESPYDVFGAGHSSTSISAALGFATARDIKQENHNVIAVIGDGALSAGMAYEAMNNASLLKSNVTVVLNDNKMSIAPAVGAMSQYLCRLISSQHFLSARGVAKDILHRMPEILETFTKKTKKYAKDLIVGGNFFEELGFHYIGPIDGHNLSQLVPILKNIKEANTIDKPILLHVLTEKGRGFVAQSKCDESYHAIGKYDKITRTPIKSNEQKPTYTEVFAKTLIKLATNDSTVVGVTAAMPSGTGLNLFAQRFKDRMFDVGIAEQHAVTFAAALALEGIKPFVAIYSTFLQRAYDQVVHDVAIQSAPVRFAIDRAGFVGADGPTHAGTFDILCLAALPNFVIMCPSDELELMRAIHTAYHINDKPSAFRFPRGTGTGIAIQDDILPYQIGKGRVLQVGNDIALLSLGTRLHECLKAASALQEERGLSVTVADAVFAKPIDRDLVYELAKNHKILITVEEGSIGGFGSHVANFLSSEGLLDGSLRFRSLFMPDRFIDQDVPYAMYEQSQLNASGIINTINKII